MALTEEQWQEAIAFAESEGINAGIAAASWVDVDESNAQRLLNLMDNGDLQDHYRYPDLSGEYADEPTPRTLREDLQHGIGEYVEDEDMDELCGIWISAASVAFENKLSERARYYLA